MKQMKMEVYKMKKVFRTYDLVDKLFQVKNSLSQIYCIDNENIVNKMIENIDDAIYIFYNYPPLTGVLSEEDRKRLSKFYLNSLYGTSSYIDTDMFNKNEFVKNEIDKIIVKCASGYIRTENEEIKNILEYIIKTSESIKESM